MEKRELKEHNNSLVKQLKNGDFETIKGQAIDSGFDPEVDDIEDWMECDRCGCLNHPDELTGKGDQHYCQHCGDN